VPISQYVNLQIKIIYRINIGTLAY